MLTRLTGKDVSALWPLIVKGLETSIERDVLAHGNTRSRILKKLLEGTIVCWLARETMDSVPSGILLTTIIEDDIIAGKSLLLYSISGIGQKLKADDFIQGFEEIEFYAKSIGCSRVVFYTRNAKIVRLMQMLSPGLLTDYTMGIMEL